MARSVHHADPLLSTGSLGEDDQNREIVILSFDEGRTRRPYKEFAVVQEQRRCSTTALRTRAGRHVLMIDAKARRSGDFTIPGGEENLLLTTRLYISLRLTGED
jgi:hypothetical protein